MREVTIQLKERTFDNGYSLYWDEETESYPIFKSYRSGYISMELGEKAQAVTKAIMNGWMEGITQINKEELAKITGLTESEVVEQMNNLCEANYLREVVVLWLDV